MNPRSAYNEPQLVMLLSAFLHPDMHQAYVIVVDLFFKMFFYLKIY
jgi:hypothetical protein